ncbi:hypothetical protein ACSBR2_018283 [Camellia fascicularis]
MIIRGGSVDGTLPISFSATTQLHSSSFTFATLTPHNNNFSSDNESSEEEPKSLCWRIEKLPRTEPVGSAFQSWMGDGFPIHRAHVFHTINRFRKLHFNKRALEVMEWVIRERPYRPKELDYSYLLEFRTKLHGVSQGEKLFLVFHPNSKMSCYTIILLLHAWIKA